MKKFLGLMIMVATLIVFAQAVGAAEIISSGNCGENGDNVKWTFDESGVLTISGEGKMEASFTPGRLPYESVTDEVTSIVIEEGVTSIGANAFAFAVANLDGKLKVKSITIPKTLKEMGQCAFAYIENVDTVYYNAEDCVFVGDSLNMANGYFAMGKSLVIGKDVKKIGANVFWRATGFRPEQNTYTSVKYEGTEEEWKNVVVEYEGNDVLEYIHFSDDASADVNKINIRILINNTFVECDQPPVLVNDGRTLVPMRAIFEALNAEVEWDGSTQTVTAVKNDKTVSLTIGKSEIVINGEVKALDVAPCLVGDRTMIPVRAVSEALDCTVNWNGYQKFVIITPENQQAYKIEAVDTDGETVATAHFNQKGQLYKVDNQSLWFFPLVVNINGNSYIDLFWKQPRDIEIVYDDSNNVSDIVVNTPYKYGYKYSYDANNCIETGKYFSDSGNGNAIKRMYFEDKKIVYPKGMGGDLKVTMELNDFGMVKEYSMSESGGSGNCGYNDKGAMTSWSGSAFATNYSYNSEGKLATARMSQFGSMQDIVISYRYINE